MNGLAAYLLALITAWYPLSTHNFTGRTEEETKARYTEIANDLATVVTDPTEVPLFADDGGHVGVGRVRTATIMLSWAGYESGGFAEDVDLMVKLGDGDAHAKCLMQLHSPYSRYVVNRVSCFREGLRAMHDSMNMCKTGSLASRLAGYTVGRCVPEEPGAVRRVDRAVKYLKETPFLFLE
jgi:hypothetical protein